MNQINGLLRYMNALQKEYGATVIIKDFIGFFPMVPSLYEQLQPYYIHQKPYCMFMKEQSGQWDRCLVQKERLYDEVVKRKMTFYGSCYAGVGEYVVPMIYGEGDGERVIGAVTIGGFIHESADHKIERLETKGLVNRSDAKSYYQESTVVNKTNSATMEERAEVISEYLMMLFDEAIRMCLEKQNASDHGYIIGHAVAYIKVHYLEGITLSDIASFCHCSNSFLSHHFREMTGKTIKGYINTLRIDKARILLSGTEESVTEVAYKVGYKDGNYFSKVFKDMTGVSPRAYRQSI